MAAGRFLSCMWLNGSFARGASVQIFAENCDKILGARRLICPDRAAGHLDEQLPTVIFHHYIADSPDVPFHVADRGGMFKGNGHINFLFDTLEAGRILNGQFHGADEIMIPTVVTEYAN